MHEVAAIQGIVHTALECMQAAGASRVTHVQMVIGTSRDFTADDVCRHFEVLTKGTPIEGASISIQWLPATYQCFSCLHRFESGESAEQMVCPRCGERALEIEHRDVCQVSSIDVSFDEEGIAALQGCELAGFVARTSLLSGEDEYALSATGKASSWS